MFYSIPEASLCDICENEDCGESCKIRADKQKSSIDDLYDGFKDAVSGNGIVLSNIVHIFVALCASTTIRFLLW